MWILLPWGCPGAAALWAGKDEAEPKTVAILWDPSPEGNAKGEKSFSKVLRITAVWFRLVGEVLPQSFQSYCPYGG